jgi:formylglycine-generating enzyme required for sulfatase activity
VRDWAVANGYTDLANVGDTYPSGMGDNFPVSDVSWYDAVKWCNAKSQKEKLIPVYKLNGAIYKAGNSNPSVNASANGYRLPAQTEWEWAARGGVKSKGYTWSGSNDPKKAGWTGDDNIDGPKAVGTRFPNELGIYDMTGNIKEYCGDILPYGVRQQRGGSFENESAHCAVHRQDFFHFPTDKNYLDGFRLARNAP